ncbi:MAG: hypothetical protein HN352_08365 [Bacteroidetes bacterium]|nr:hypothetical protein [Bacteroidota bacterium]MBT3748446.1 hypothetical protein [Bacteroidota bacterium]MBT4400716.1 hypothetical protein [Bacteroidota bacterium]MBT4408220.1 hypothetical protein [Bacteroidota bacterium]MBT5424798.1 hypothetical protein [Bacteroidota bacterium]
MPHTQVIIICFSKFKIINQPEIIRCTSPCQFNNDVSHSRCYLRNVRFKNCNLSSTNIIRAILMPTTKACIIGSPVNSIII